MKIIFVSDAIFPYNKGGKEKRIFELSTRLSKKGNDVHIYTMKWWQGNSIRQENSVTLHGVCPLKSLYVNGRRSIWQAIYFAMKIFFPLLKAKFDIMEVDHMPHFPVYTCKLVTLLKRKKLFVTWHEVWGKKYWLDYLGNKGYFGYLVEKYSTKLPDIFIAVSEFTAKRLVNTFHVSEKKIKIINSGINFSEINKLKETEKKYDLIYGGRFLIHKKIDFLIETIAYLKKDFPNIKAVISGGGPEEKKLIDLTNKLGLKNNINFPGFCSAEEFYKLLKQSKIYISLSIREGLGLSVLEANAVGLPAIIVNHPDNATKSLISDGNNGFICKIDIKDIAEKIKLLLNNFQMLQQMENDSRKFSQRFDWQNITDELMHLYKKSI